MKCEVRKEFNTMQKFKRSAKELHQM